MNAMGIQFIYLVGIHVIGRQFVFRPCDRNPVSASVEIVSDACGRYSIIFEWEYYY